jgi:hypothetical protein
LSSTNPTSSVCELRYSCSISCTNFDSLARNLVVSHDSRMEIITHTNIVVLEIFKLFYMLVEQELLTLPEHLSSPPVFSGVRVTRSLVLYVCFVDRCLSFCTFSFGHCVVCSSSIYEFWLLLFLYILFCEYFVSLLVFCSMSILSMSKNPTVSYSFV